MGCGNGLGVPQEANEEKASAPRQREHCVLAGAATEDKKEKGTALQAGSGNS